MKSIAQSVFELTPHPVELTNKDTGKKVIFADRKDVYSFCKSENMDKTSDIWKVIKGTLNSRKGWVLS